VPTRLEIDDKAKDKHAAICKDCFVKQSYADLVNVPIGIVSLIATTVVAD